MKRFLPILLALLSPATSAQGEESGCVVCHGAEAKGFEIGVHGAIAETCTACHGGDATAFDEATAHGEGFRPLSDPRAAVESCASCHADREAMSGFGLGTDQAEVYWTSPHGRRLAEEGDPNVATCVTCHGAHGILRHTDPRSPIHPFRQARTCGECHGDAERMEPYGIDAGVVDAYSESVHGRALLDESRLSSPACTDCHGSHGATPPRVEEVGRVCGHCHSVVRDYFAEGPHLAPSLAGEMDECVSCHGSHTIARSSVEAFAGRGMGACTTCHTSGEGTALAIADRLHEGLTGLDRAIEEAQEEIRRAAEGGLFIEREHGFLDDARSLRSRTRALTHALSDDLLADLLNRGQAAVLETHESLAVKERKLRDRKIFTGIFLGVSLLLALVLQTYRREVYGPLRTRADARALEPASGDGVETSTSTEA